jgi:hypothetical protein
MTNRFTTLAAAAALFIGLSAPAAADDYVTVATVGTWTILADETLCKAQSEYEDGSTLTFGINAKGGAALSIDDPKWSIPEGEFPVVAWVDRIERRTFTATAKDTWIVFGFALNEGSIAALSNGAVLNLEVGRSTYRYRLTRSAEMLRALGACAAERMPKANPFAGSPSSGGAANPFAETASNPYRRM